jgi:hypothetical protein
VSKYGCLFIICLIFAGCVKKAPPETEAQGTPLPELGISVKVPPELSPFTAEALESLRADTAVEAPVEPFTALPRYAFRNFDSRTLLIFYTLSPMPSIREDTGINNFYAYRRNLEDHYEVVSRELIQGDFTFIVLNVPFTYGGEELILNKGVYFKRPDRFFMVDLINLREKVNPEEAAKYEAMLLSIQALKE